MKAILSLSASAVLLAGCASSENGRVSYQKDGTKVYGLDDQPQSAIAGEGTLMPGAYDSRDMPTGQFTGKERTQDFVGQNPVTPREADPREFSREPRQVGSGIVPPGPGSGAGSLGQSGIQNDVSVSSSTLQTGPTNPRLIPSAPASASANPPTGATAPTLAQPLTRKNNSDVTTGVGSSPGFQSSSSSSLNLNSSALPRPSSSITPAPGQESTLSSATPELTDRIRNALTTGRPDSITHLTPDRLQDFEIEAVSGNVTLRGTARSETEKLMIGNKVSHIEGVRSVNNQLRVISPTREGTEDVTSPIDRANPLHSEK